MLKTKIKKEALETEIELLENQIKQKKGELRHSFTSLNDCDYEAMANAATAVSSNRLNHSVDNSKQLSNYQNKVCYIKPISETQKHPFTYEDVIFFILWF